MLLTPTSTMEPSGRRQLRLTATSRYLLDARPRSGQLQCKSVATHTHSSGLQTIIRDYTTIIRFAKLHAPGWWTCYLRILSKNISNHYDSLFFQRCKFIVFFLVFGTFLGTCWQNWPPRNRTIASLAERLQVYTARPPLTCLPAKKNISINAE